jgi:hypothetical protein
MREPDFRRLWSAQFVSNIGSWMQTVAAQWVMLSLTTSALLVSAISAAASIPVLLLAVPAGALGDLADRGDRTPASWTVHEDGQLFGFVVRSVCLSSLSLPKGRLVRRPEDRSLVDSDQTASGKDQTASDSDQTASDRDQTASDGDQTAFEEGQIRPRISSAGRITTFGSP